MLDPRAIAVVIRNKDNQGHEDKTLDIVEFDPQPERAFVRFGGAKKYPFGWDRVIVLRRPQQISMRPHEVLLIDGSPTDAREAYLFTGPPHTGSWWHVLDRAGAWTACGAARAKVVRNAAGAASAKNVLAYWRDVAGRLTGDSGTLLRNHQGLSFVHPDSALARILERGPIERRPDDEIPLAVYPFRTNISQSQAVTRALQYPLSVIDGPPGTGKTQTILNIIASVICRPEATVGVVSFTNSAVDNVFEKLTRERFGMVAANLGNTVKRQEFFDRQGVRNEAVDTLLHNGTEPAEEAADTLRTMTGRLTELLEHERDCAELRNQLHAYRLEQSHFQSFLDRHEVPDADKLPLLRRYSANKLLDFIADTDPAWIRDRGWARLVATMNRYFKYWALRKVDADDVDIVLEIQRLYYDKKIAELERRVDRLTRSLDGRNFDRLRSEHTKLSQELLAAALRTRYRALTRTVYTFRYRHNFRQFSQDYPLILSTCHSLPNSIGPSALLDYLIIDEASQVDLVTVAPALARARNLIVVGDLNQLAPIDKNLAGVPPAPDPVFEYTHSILGAIVDRYGGEVPRTMLREHYRCDPDIIEFCNRKFYSGELIPYTKPAPGTTPMAVVRTSPGNHMRQRYNDPTSNGRSNQREIDVILHEALPWIAADIPPHRIGVTTPFRRQADKAADALIEDIESDTVHKYQGREKDAIVMSTVLDSRAGDEVVKFADDPRLINVAVSRAMRSFILVTHPSELPKSRHIRDLIGYIRHRDPNHAVIDSDVVSIFDLLYSDYNERRRRNPRITWGRTAVPSEDIALALLEEILGAPQYQHLGMERQVLLANVFRRDLTGLDPRQREFIRNRASFDFVLFNRITNATLVSIEVDGFRTHEADPVQLARDAVKDEICHHYGFPLLRLSTTGSNEAGRVCHFLDRHC
ncbi:AAA domain-containing protein [Nocardia cyriacigeorgica]|uniref:AAA domain-containing protein n=1 Tax=Nocardia cyriacigeorgica TaxID=135487 RepID=UPI002454806D|nr:AAA domain-containing protein [Nocardia cyriacigeorgica]